MLLASIPETSATDKKDGKPELDKDGCEVIYMDKNPDMEAEMLQLVNSKRNSV